MRAIFRDVLMLPTSLLLLSLVLVAAFCYALQRSRQRRAGRDAEIPAPNSEHRDKAPTQLPPLPAFVTAWDNESIGRDQWVLRMTRHVFKQRHDSAHNVVVINDDLEYHFAPEGVIEDLRVVYKDARNTVPYRIVVFRQGELINLGDGGDINWDWMGNFVRRNGAQISFGVCKLGVHYQQDPWVSVSPALEKS